MDALAFFMAWTPVLLLVFLAVVLGRPALDLAIWSTIFTALLTGFYFSTPLGVVGLSALDGALTTLPLVLVIFFGILLSNLLMGIGSLKRLVDWFMRGVRTPYHRGLLITMGVGNFMEGAGVIAEPVVAPMLAAAGVSPVGAAALSIIGYSGLMTLEMAGIVITVLSLVTGLPLYDLGLASAWLSLPAALLMALMVPFYLPAQGSLARRLGLALGAGLALGLLTLATVAWVAVSISGMLAGLGLIALLIFTGNRRLPVNSGVLADLAPFLFLLAALFLLNTVPPLKELTFHRLSLTIAVIPVHKITFRPLYSAYLYLLLAFLLSAFLGRVGGDRLMQVVRAGLTKAWRPSLSMLLFGAMGQIIAFSGYDAAFAHLSEADNLPRVLAQGLSMYTGSAYPVFVPLLGWVGTFLTGYGVAALMLFGPLMVTAGALLGVDAVWLAAGLAVGASLGSISSPFKIAIATPMCGAEGREGELLRVTIPAGVGASLAVGMVLWMVL